MVESPEWLENSKARSSTSSIDEQDEQQRLLGQAAGPLYDNEGSSRSTGEAPSTMSGVIKSPLTRRGLTIVVLTQITQQASGINAGERDGCYEGVCGDSTLTLFFLTCTHSPVLLHRHHEEGIACEGWGHRASHHRCQSSHGEAQRAPPSLRRRVLRVLTLYNPPSDLSTDVPYRCGCSTPG